MLEDTLKAALRFGLSEETFWQMTIAEIERYISARSEQLEFEARLQRVHAYNVASMTASFVRRAFDGEAIPDIAEVFPDMVTTPEEREAREAAIIKERLLDFAENANKARGKHDS